MSDTHALSRIPSIISTRTKPVESPLMSLITRSTYSHGRWHVIAYRSRWRSMAFFLFNLFSLRHSGRYRDWRHKLSAACQLTHSRTPLGTEVKDEVKPTDSLGLHYPLLCVSWAYNILLWTSRKRMSVCPGSCEERARQTGGKFVV